MSDPIPIQIKRTTSVNTPPSGLLPGELAVEMSAPTKLWVGVPSSIDPSSRVLLIDTSAAFNAYNKSESDIRYVNTAGDNMTGVLSLSGPPTLANHAATKAYVDSLTGAGSACVLKAGDTMTGRLTINTTDPYSLYAPNRFVISNQANGRVRLGADAGGASAAADAADLVIAGAAYPGPCGMTFNAGNATTGKINWRNATSTAMLALIGDLNDAIPKFSFSILGNALGEFNITNHPNGRINVGPAMFSAQADSADLVINNPAGTGPCGMTFNVGTAADNGKISWRSDVSAVALSITGDMVGSRLGFGVQGVDAFNITNNVNGRVHVGPATAQAHANAADLVITNPNGSGNCGMTFNLNNATSGGNIYWRSDTSPAAQAISADIAAKAMAFWVDGIQLLSVVNNYTSIRVGSTSEATSYAAASFVTNGGAGIAKNLQLGGTAYKPGGGPFGDSSDARIKTVKGAYEHGLEQLQQINPIRYVFKGNDDMVHAPNGPEYVGIVAQDIEKVMPETVTKRTGLIDNVAVKDLRMFDSGPLVFALINAVKELADRVAQLEGRAI
jgi:hypothetical protein